MLRQWGWEKQKPNENCCSDLEQQIIMIPKWDSKALLIQKQLRKMTHEVVLIYPVIQPIDVTYCFVLESHLWLCKDSAFEDIYNSLTWMMETFSFSLIITSRSVSDINRSYNLLFGAKSINGLAKWHKNLCRFIYVSNQSTLISWVVLKTHFWLYKASEPVGQILVSLSIACSPIQLFSYMRSACWPLVILKAERRKR